MTRRQLTPPGGKALICVCLVLATIIFISAYNLTSMLFENNIFWRRQTRPQAILTELINNNGAIHYLKKYQELFMTTRNVSMTADPHRPDTVTAWWQAAAIIDWYLNSPVRYQCQQIVRMGNWNICQDPPFTVKPPCLVYSFGINFDFSFDDAMEKLGCEVHSFDPSMAMNDHKRNSNSYFHNMGLASYNTDAYIPRRDIYVKNNETWKVRTAKSIRSELGHENRVIDVFKMDVEGYEWAVLENMMETEVFASIRQYMLEFHLFPDFPLKEDYVHIYKVYTKLRAMGFREFSVRPHPETLNVERFNIQGDCEFLNLNFQGER